MSLKVYNRKRNFSETPEPKGTKEAAKLAKKHSEKMEGRSLTKMTGEFPFRHAIEVRHKSFVNKNFFDLLNAHNVAWVLAHTGPAYTEEVTADFIYARMHGEDKAYKKGHPKKFLQEWVKKLKDWNKKENYIYFDTEAKKFAPYDAMELARMVKE